ncbi:MAG: GNAT family N-acetyltransferase [Candidatus Odinarchaeota archaeon]
MGRALIDLLVKKAKKFGCTSIFLNTGSFMTAAPRFYRSFGFFEREGYPESEVPQIIKHFWLFMEKNCSL